jgi:predicted negative regulator of RcsB-dependent stress response
MPGQNHRRRATLKSIVIGVLIAAVVVLGYLYWDSQHNTVFKAPGIEIKKN